MTCSIASKDPGPFCPRAMASAAVLALSVFALPYGAMETKGWLAGSLQVEAADYRLGELISLKGAIENGDPFRATRIMVAAGQDPDPLVWQVALRGITTGHLGS